MVFLCQKFDWFWMIFVIFGWVLSDILSAFDFALWGHKASVASPRRSSRSLLWTAGLAYSPAVVPVDWFVLESCSQFEHKVDTGVSRLVVWHVFLWELCPVRAVSRYRSLPGLITINKSAYFLIVTRQNTHFTRILAENQLHDQKNGCFLDRNRMNLTTIVKWQTLKHAEVKYGTLNRVLCALRFWGKDMRVQ